MSQNFYVLVLATRSLKEIKPKIKELNGFYNQIGYAFPYQKKAEVEKLFNHFDKESIKIIEQPLIGNFESYAQSHQVDWCRKALNEKKNEISLFKYVLKKPELLESEIDSLNDISIENKNKLIKLLEEKEDLKERLLWAESIEKTMLDQAKNSLNLTFLSELPVNFLEIDAPQKPRLLTWTEKNGYKHSFLPKEIVGMLVAAGGAGKTHLLTQLALCIATGIPFLGKFEIENPGSVCFALGENKLDDIHRVFRKTAKNLKKWVETNDQNPNHARFGLFEKNPFEKALSRISILSVHGAKAHFIKNGIATDYYMNFLNELKMRQPSEGWSLIILDPASRFAGLDVEKDNAIATDFIALLEKMSDELKGNPTVLIAHHKPKPAVSSKESDQTAARGASGLTDGVRWQANLDRQDDQSIIFRIVKSNFTSILPEFKIKKESDGTLAYDISSDKNNYEGRGSEIISKLKKEKNKIYEM